MKIEQFSEYIPVERLEQELAGKEVAIEILIVDNCQRHLGNSEQRYLERFPSRQPTLEELRDFTAIHYTPLLQVWNQCHAGLEHRPGFGLDEIVNPALRVLCMTTTIVSFKHVRSPRDVEPELELVEIENTAGLGLWFPTHPPEERVLSMTITSNSVTHRREYALRFYNTAIVISLLES